MTRFLVLACLLFLSFGCQFGQKAREIVHPAPKTQERGVWLSKNEMLRPRAELEALLDRFQAANLNAVYINIQLRGFIMYPESRILPQWAEMAEHDREIITWLVPAIQERGMRAEAWMEYGYYAYWTPDANVDESMGPILDAHPDLLSIDSRGNRYLHNVNWGDFYSLCPTNPKSHDILIDMMDEALVLHPFDGINLDRIRYATDNHCYCPHCQSLFKQETGIPLEVFEPGSDNAATFNQWRKEQLFRFMEKLSTRLRTNHPDKTITAAVMPPYLVDIKAQDWYHWLEQGWLDAAMPMMYLPNLTEETRRLRDRTGKDSMVIYGLDAERGQETLMRQLRELEELGVTGYAFWFSGAIEPMLEDIGREFFTEPIASPLGGPRR